jgi:hypothetical protein
MILNVHCMCPIRMERRELDHSKNIKVGIRYFVPALCISDRQLCQYHNYKPHYLFEVRFLLTPM